MHRSKKRKHSRSKSKDSKRYRNTSNGKLEKMQDQLDNLTNVISTLVKTKEAQTASNQLEQQIPTDTNVGT